MKDLACWWDGTQWYVNVPFLLSPLQMVAIRERVLEVNVRRLIGLRAGDARDDLMKSIDALQAGKMRQNIVAGKVFEAYPFESDRMFSIPGGASGNRNC